MKAVRLLKGDCLETLRIIPSESVDACVTDPPYELGFMGKSWDRTGIANNVDLWREVLRVLKPGGHLLAFSGTRTYHRMVCAIEDAGFQIRDQIGWLYGSGFPKSLDVSKAIDKSDGIEIGRTRALKFTAWMRSTGITSAQINDATDSSMGSHYLAEKEQPAVATLEMFGMMKHLLPAPPKEIMRLMQWRTIESENFKKRQVVGKGSSAIANKAEGQRHTIGASKAVEFDITAPATDAAKKWQGWGTALKPAWEPIVVARKPLIGTVAKNVQLHGTGAINVDGCRVKTNDKLGGGMVSMGRPKAGEGWDRPWMHDLDITAKKKIESALKVEHAQANGRWPANVIHDGSDEVLAEFAKLGEKTSGAMKREVAGYNGDSIFMNGRSGPSNQHGNTGTAARFFYCAKASKRDRDEGLERHEPKPRPTMGNGIGGQPDQSRANNRNHHPTVKPTALMRYLCKLVTPPGGTVLDPFTGSGSTGKAAKLEGFKFIGIEREPEYLAIAEARIARRNERAPKQKYRNTE